MGSLLKLPVRPSVDRRLSADDGNRPDYRHEAHDLPDVCVPADLLEQENAPSSRTFDALNLMGVVYLVACALIGIVVSTIWAWQAIAAFGYSLAWIYRRLF